MELKEVIKKRRSIRKYQSKPVLWETIAEVLEAARLAPAAGNLQSYRFIVIRNEEKKKELSKICHDQHWMAKAPAQIAVIATVSKLARLYGERGESNYAYQNANAAICNLILSANDLGLGTCWVTAFDDKKINDALSVEDGKPIAIITLGYPREKPSSPTRDPLKNLVYFEEWGNKERASTVNRPFEKPIKRGFHGLKEALKALKSSNKELGK
jgi:nitroreductase